ncbi:MAG: ATP-binding cassette domain-containing protein [Verrucomicrobiae bacterium]|nr:ATP-binding cassette domain-containing protein [Verrucomicrobiae bacterium]NNJ42825.1 ATP-binding cassette domain-containing protein [Akkermansiaceae bacterium]
MSESSPDVPLIRVRGLHQHFGDNHVLRGVDLDVHKGETLCLLSSSGGGKTVLVKHMLGLMQPDKGTIEVDGVDISHMRERHLGPVRKKLGMMFQNSALFDSMTVAQNIAFPLHEQGIKDINELNRRVSDVLEIVRLPGQENKMPSDLSGGMKKRVALARAIVDRPTCVCYDEPHAGLDPITAGSIDKLIKRLQHDFGITNIVITHELRSVFRIADRIIFMKDGTVYWQGTPAEMQVSQDPVLTSFLTGDDSETHA